MKITMIGKSGSGKTTFMSGLYEILGGGRVARFFIRPVTQDFKSQILNLGNFSRISFGSRNYEFPPGTQQSTVWTFELVYGDQIVCNFEWIDYRGGILEDVYDINLPTDKKMQDQVNDLMGHILLSDAVILFADSILLSSYANQRLRQLHTGASTINQLMRQYATYFPDKNLNVLIGLTKADSDAIGSEWKQNNYEKLISVGLDTFDEVVDICKYKAGYWQGAIVPIGCVGDGNVVTTVTKAKDFRQPIGVTTQIVNYPQPMNVEHVMFYCLGQILKQVYIKAKRDADVYQMLRDTKKQETGFVNEILARIFREPNPSDEVKEYDSKMRKERARLALLAPSIEPLYKIALQKVRLIQPQ